MWHQGDHKGRPYAARSLRFALAPYDLPPAKLTRSSPQPTGRIMNELVKPPVGMLPTERLDYSAITARKPLKLPKGARMVVWTIVNVEEWDPTQTMPRTVLTPPAGGSPMPDIPNWCWHEYGNRVGFWRLLQVYDDFKIPGV